MQAAKERLGLIALAPMATALGQGSVRRFEYGVGGEGVADAWWLWLELYQQMACKPQLQAVPWGFVQTSTCEQHKGSLQLHAETKALTVLLSDGALADLSYASRLSSPTPICRYLACGRRKPPPQFGAS